MAQLDNHRLFEERSLLRAISDNASVALFIMDDRQHCVFMNPAAERLTGFALGEVSGRPLHDVIHHTHPDGRPYPLADCPIDRACLQNDREQGEEVFIHKDGHFYDVAFTASPIRDGHGKAIGTVIEVQEITQQKASAQSLEATRRKLDSALIAGEVGTFEWDTRRARVWGDSNFAAMFNIPLDADGTAPLERYLQAIHPGDLERVEACIEETVQHGTDYEIAYRVIRGERTRWLLVRAKVERDDDGQVIRAPGVVLDITEAKRAEEALRESEGRFRLLADGLPLIVWMHDAKGSLQFVNQTYCEYFNITHEAVREGGWQILIHPHDAPAYVDSFLAAAAQRRVWTGECRVRSGKGEWRWLQSWARPRLSDTGEHLGMVGCSADVTERKAFEAERETLLESEREAREQAEREGRLKDEFLSTLSHELRTLLNAILGWTTILQRSKTAVQDLPEALSVIERNAKAQTQLIEDLLDMSRIISGKVRLDVQQVNLSDVITAAMDVVRPTAENKGVRLQQTLDPHAGPVSGDPSRLQQVLWNLLTNAVKFTPKGGRVHVVLERVNSHIEISVSDTGKGINPDFLPHVFDRFRQEDSTASRQYGGLGLGLAIVKHLVELHGGTVRAKSRGEGEGATFIIMLPLAPILGDVDDGSPRHHPVRDAEVGIPCDPPTLDHVRILIVDDDRDSRAILERVLQECGAEVETAKSAQDALAALDRNRFDLLISDIGMPEIDGYELIRRVRSLPADRGGGIPALAVTAFARSPDRRRTLMAGYQSHLSKPFDPEELRTVCASLTGMLGEGRSEHRHNSDS